MESGFCSLATVPLILEPKDAEGRVCVTDPKVLEDGRRYLTKGHHPSSHHNTRVTIYNISTTTHLLSTILSKTYKYVSLNLNKEPKERASRYLWVALVWALPAGVWVSFQRIVCPYFHSIFPPPFGDILPYTISVLSLVLHHILFFSVSLGMCICWDPLEYPY